MWKNESVMKFAKWKNESAVKFAKTKNRSAKNEKFDLFLRERLKDREIIL